MKENKKNNSIKKEKNIKEEKPIVEKINLNDYVSSGKEKKKGIIGTIILIILVGILLFGDLFEFDKKTDKNKEKEGQNVEEKEDENNKDEEDKKDEEKDKEKITVPVIGDSIIANSNMKYSTSSDRAVLNINMYSVSESNYFVKPNEELTVNHIAIVGEDGKIYGYTSDTSVSASDFVKELNVTDYKIVYHVKTESTDIGWIVYNENDYNLK